MAKITVKRRYTLTVLSYLIAIAIIAIVLLLSGCGTKEANGYNLPSPTRNDTHIVWIRIWSPKEYATIMFGCFGEEGIYDPESSGGNQSITVIGNDDHC